MGTVGWRRAMESGLYGPGGFFAGDGSGPAGHFRTSVHASPLFAGAMLRLIERVDAALGHPDRFDVVDVGAGRGELLTALGALLPSARATLGGRIRLVGVEVAARPAALPAEIGWRHTVPDGTVGLLVATEWLDNVPLDLVQVDGRGGPRQVLVDVATGVETLGAPVDAAGRFWLARWWPAVLGSPVDDPVGQPPPAIEARAGTGARAEVGWTRDVAWADAVSSIRRGAALAVDYGHVRDSRPWRGTLTGFRDGRQVEPVPDGSCDVTAHVAMDSAAEAAGTAYTLRSQRAALRALGVDGGRPPLDLARADPAGYLRALAAAGAAAELTDPAGLGGHWWLLHTIGIEPVLP